MAFDPSLTAAAANGVRSTRQPYPSGAPAVRMSLDAMAQKIREGRLDPAVAGWARKVLKDSGLDGRDRPSVRAQASAVLEALRSQTVYAPDAYGAEVISSAAGTLCLRPNLCINGGDCDDLTVAYLSAMWSLGIPVAIVKQNYGTDYQEHVLGAVQDETGEWLYADPSTRQPLGRGPKAESEVWIDPAGPVGPLPEMGAEIVTLGKPGVGAAAAGGSASASSLASTSTPTPNVPTSGLAYTIITGNQVFAGQRVRIGMLASGGLLNPDDTDADRAAQIKIMFAPDFYVETVGPDGNVTGMFQSWLLQGIAKNAVAVVSPSSDIQIVTIAVQATAPTTAPTPGPANPNVPAQPKATVIGLEGVLVIGAVAAVAGGVWWGAHQRKRRRR